MKNAPESTRGAPPKRGSTASAIINVRVDVDRKNPYTRFAKKRRTGDKTLAGLVIETLDTATDYRRNENNENHINLTNTMKFKIVLNERSNSKTSTLAEGLDRDEAIKLAPSFFAAAKAAPSEVTSLEVVECDTRSIQDAVMDDAISAPEIAARHDFEFGEPI